MGRPSNRDERRAQLVAAFARVLSRHGYAGATIAAVAAEAGIAPGLVHHHLDSKEELLTALLGDLLARFRRRAHDGDGVRDPLQGYLEAALKLDARADIVSARCWVGLFAEALRNPTLFRQVRRLIDTELGVIQRHARGGLSEHDSAALLAFVIGALVLGAFAPQKTAGFAAPAARRLAQALRSDRP